MTMMGESKHDLRPQIAGWLALFCGYSELACLNFITKGQRPAFPNSHSQLGEVLFLHCK